MNRKRRHHGGFTIVELLVASTVGLLLVIGVIEAFRQIANAVNKGRANVQLSGKLRNTINLLREDFQGITVPAIPNISTDSGAGYFEIIEGEDNDLIQSATDTLSGDTDDFIMFTSRRLGEPFSGRFKGEAITSPNAEIIYWLDRGIWDGSAQLQHNEMPLFTLRRRALLIRPDLNEDYYSNGELVYAGVIIVDNVAPKYNSLTVKNFLNENDISVRVNPDGTLSANTLSDLTLRQNRVAHKRSAGKSRYGNDTVGYTFIDVNFPYRFDPARLPYQWGNFMGEDVVMDQVIGFDVRVYDPLVKIVADRDPIDTNGDGGISLDELQNSGSEPLTPGDPGYQDRALTNAIGRGAYIDLGFASRINLTKQQVGGTSLCVDIVSPFNFGNGNVYDTWTIEYERDGVDQDWGRVGGRGADQGNDGIDNNGSGGIDDITEVETMPPYPISLRGFQVIVRAFQNGQQQTRQFTITHDFTPE